MSRPTDHELDKLRPNGKARQLRVRLDPAEEAGFKLAAHMAGLSLSAWVRTHLREAAERRLANAGERAGWLKPRRS